MSDLISRIRQRYDDARRAIEVPEWGITVYASPYTLQDDRAIAGYIRDDDPAGFLEVLIRKAEDEKGEPLFTREDKPRLMRIAEAAVVKRIAIEIMATATVEEQKKS